MKNVSIFFSIILSFLMLQSCIDTVTQVENLTPELTGGLQEGKTIVDKNCFVCHAQGLNGAPIIGNIKMWQPRIQQDVATLISHAENGYGLMPAKGGKVNLTHEELTLAVNYMLSTLE